MEIKDRINEFRKNKKMNVSAFEIKAGMSNGCWASSSNLREETLLKIVKAFRQQKETPTNKKHNKK